MTFFVIRALTLILEPTRWLTRRFFLTSMSNDAGSEAASWKGTSCVRHHQHALFARLQNFISIAVGWRQVRHPARL